MVRLFPVSPTKRPLIKGWPDEATNNPVRLRRWMWRFPGCWWGLVLDGLLVLDFDLGERGYGEPVQGFIAEFGPESLPQSANWRRTRSGGLHVVTRAPADLVQWNGRDFRRYDGGKVDVKLGRGCFIVVEGDGYGFLRGADTFDPAELPETPAAVADAVRLKLAHHSLSLSYDPEEWRRLVWWSRKFWPAPIIDRALRHDCARLPTVASGQGAEVNRLAFVWGRKVAQRSISAALAYHSLRTAALQMIPLAGDHWPEPEVWVERQLKRAMLAGAESVRREKGQGDAR